MATRTRSTATPAAPKSNRRGTGTRTPAPAPAAPATDPMAAVIKASGAKGTGRAPAAPKEPKVNVNETKNSLARAMIVAAGDALKAMPDSTFEGFALKVRGTDLAGRDAALAWAAQILHYLPVGGVWPEGAIPVPARSDWAGKISGVNAA